jgi:hypothetical protein
VPGINIAAVSGVRWRDVTSALSYLFLSIELACQGQKEKKKGGLGGGGDVTRVVVVDGRFSRREVAWLGSP